MISNNALGSKLNAYKYKDSDTNQPESSVKEESIKQNVVDEKIDEDQTDQRLTTLNLLYDTVINTITLLLNSTCFGYGLELVLGASWPILGTLAVGYSINFVLNKTLNAFIQ